MRTLLTAIAIVVIVVGGSCAAADRIAGASLPAESPLAFKYYDRIFSYQLGDMNSLAQQTGKPDLSVEGGGAAFRFSVRRDGDQFSLSADADCDNGDDVYPLGFGIIAWVLEASSAVVIVVNSEGILTTYGVRRSTHLRVRDFETFRENDTGIANFAVADGGDTARLEPGTYRIDYTAYTSCYSTQPYSGTIHFEDDQGNVLPVNLPTREYASPDASHEHNRELIEAYHSSR